jgi:hypothetical protein
MRQYRQTPRQRDRIERLIRSSERWALTTKRKLDTAKRQSGEDEYSEEMAMLYDQEANEAAEYILTNIEKAKKLNPTTDQIDDLWAIYGKAQQELIAYEDDLR